MEMVQMCRNPLFPSQNITHVNLNLVLTDREMQSEIYMGVAGPPKDENVHISQNQTEWKEKENGLQ